MDDLLNFILKIEKRPGLWIGNNDIRSLRHLLSGYCIAKSEEKGNEEYGNWLFNDFRIYLAEKYEDNRSYDWSGLIIENELDGNSTDAFFRLLHEYLVECPL